MTESLNLIDFGNDFVFGSGHRLTLFGKFNLVAMTDVYYSVNSRMISYY